jgi:endonuclease YncB( thermonuclease family)
LLIFSWLFFIFYLASVSYKDENKTLDDRIFVEVVSIYDGDTFFCDVPEWPDIIGKRIGVRLADIDAPEMKGIEKEQGRISKQFLVEKLRSAMTVELKNIERDKYFRIVADVYVDGKNINQMMLNAEMAEKWKE